MEREFPISVTRHIYFTCRTQKKVKSKQTHLISAFTQNGITGTGFMCQPETNFKKQTTKETTNPEYSLSSKNFMFRIKGLYFSLLGSYKNGAS